MLIFLILILSSVAAAQTVSRYEVEMLKNSDKGSKDTREINSVLIFEKESIRIDSRRKKETFKEIKYSDIKYVEHSYSQAPEFTDSTRDLVLAMFTGGWTFLLRKPEKHWVTILSEKDFVVLKVENDNYRLIKMEFLVRDFEVMNVNENR